MKISTYKYLALGLFFTASVAGAATLSVSPANGTYSSGQTFTVNVLLDTTGASIDGVDVRYLRFNPSVLQVVDSNTSVSGVQVSPGTLMSSTLTNTADNQTGLITFSQIVAGGQHYQGSGTLFTVTFRAISGGSSSLTFDAVSGVTTDSNVASAGADVLGSAGSAQFTISGQVVATPNPTPNTGGVGVFLSRTLFVGSKGEDVINLQNYLISSGYLSAGNNSGFFGQLTRAAVQKYQCEKLSVCSGSESTTGYGSVGARTRASLSGGVAVTPTTPSAGGVSLKRSLGFGSRGADVTLLQNFLIAKGYLNSGSNSGYFGALTRAAVQKYQCEKLSVCSGSESTTGYGFVGVKTRASISQ